MKKYKAILLDSDGVLAKTMEDNYRAWHRAFSDYGGSINAEEYFLLEGSNTIDIAVFFLKKNAMSLDLVDELVELKEKYYSDDNAFAFYRGAEQLVSCLRQSGYMLGLVSGASYRRMVGSTGEEFLRNFDVVISGDGVSKCKPRPDPYLSAAKRLSLDSNDCLVIENAPIGIDSTSRAGMDCIAIWSTLDERFLKKAV